MQDPMDLGPRPITKPFSQDAFLKDLTQALMARYSLTEATALQVLGLYLKITNSYDTVKDTVDYIENLKKTKIETLSQDQLIMLVVLGHLRKKKTPHIAGPKISRNDNCPCGSGLKYKLCCLNKLTASDIGG